MTVAWWTALHGQGVTEERFTKSQQEQDEKLRQAIAKVREFIACCAPWQFEKTDVKSSIAQNGKDAARAESKADSALSQLADYKVKEERLDAKVNTVKDMLEKQKR